LNDTFWLAKIFHYSEKYFQADAGGRVTLERAAVTARLGAG
jgi:hypothetical protein